MTATFTNPFRPGAGHKPPYLAGREEEKREFDRLLQQDIILENMVLTGLRGLGKTVLLEELKARAIAAGWRWVGTDLSESTSVSEESLATRLFTDLAVVTSTIVISTSQTQTPGFGTTPSQVEQTLNYGALMLVYNSTNGLVYDKLKATLETAWETLRPHTKRGLIFAYDEAQNLSDQAQKEQYPLSLLLDVFQSLQRRNIPFMLVLTGLPTLFPKLVEARTYAERMFRVVTLEKLNDIESGEAIAKPIADAGCPVNIHPVSIRVIVGMSGGYPYFIQFICREVYDVFLQRMTDGEEPSVPTVEITRKLDTDFFAGRWSRATDRQRELLGVIARLPNCDAEFTVQEIVERSDRALDNPFSNSHVSQLLTSLTAQGLIYKNRHGKYSFAVPLLGDFIARQLHVARDRSETGP